MFRCGELDCCEVCCVVVRQVRLGVVWSGMVRSGEVRQVRFGLVRSGLVRFGEVRQVWFGIY